MEVLNMELLLEGPILYFHDCGMKSITWVYYDATE